MPYSGFFTSTSDDSDTGNPQTLLWDTEVSITSPYWMLRTVLCSGNLPVENLRFREVLLLSTPSGSPSMPCVFAHDLPISWTSLPLCLMKPHWPIRDQLWVGRVHLPALAHSTLGLLELFDSYHVEDGWLYTCPKAVTSSMACFISGIQCLSWHLKLRGCLSNMAPRLGSQDPTTNFCQPFSALCPSPGKSSGSRK